MYQLCERLMAGKPRLLRLLADLQAAGTCGRTLYLAPETVAEFRTACPGWLGPLSPVEEVAGAIEQVGSPETGLALFWGEYSAVAVVPPFPLLHQGFSDRLDVGPLVELLERDVLVGVVLLRLGWYAVGVLRGQSLVASKTGSRYVKRRHRAGGSSQRRFERSRERLVRELFDKTCEVCVNVFTPFEKEMDYILMGGESRTLRGFTDRCRYLERIAAKMLTRVLQVDRPGQAALERIASQVWSSRVLKFERRYSS